jgi:hypothetical protein
LLRCEGIEASPEGKVKLNMLAASSSDFAIGNASIVRRDAARHFPPHWTVDPLLAHILTEDVEIAGWGTFRVGGA